jgi:hypothetical protein
MAVNQAYIRAEYCEWCGTFPAQPDNIVNPVLSRGLLNNVYDKVIPKKYTLSNNYFHSIKVYFVWGTDSILDRQYCVQFN